VNRTQDAAYLLRPGGPGDAELIRDFVCGLSPRSQQFRFFAGVAPPSSSLLRALCGGTGADILLVTDRAGQVIGHGMAADEPASAGTASNIGLVIADRWQWHGLGTLLLSVLVSRVASRGVSSLVLDVLPLNRPMLGIVARRWPDAPRERTSDAIVIRPPITAREAAGEWPVPGVVGLHDDRFYHLGGRHAPRRPAA